MALVNSQPAPALVHRYRPLDRAEYGRRLSINACWPCKILLSVTIELLRHCFVTYSDTSETRDHVMSETEEIKHICDILQNGKFKPVDWSEDAVRYHFQNFNFPALTHIITELSKYETRDLQEPSTYEEDKPNYDGIEISIQVIWAGQLLNKDISDQPFDMNGLTTTLRRILDWARKHNFTEVYGVNSAFWVGYEDAEKFDSYVFEKVCTSALNDVYEEHGARTRTEQTYCEEIFNKIGYHEIQKEAPAPMPSTKEQYISSWLDKLPEATDPERTEPRNIVCWSVHGLHQILEDGNRLVWEM